MHVHCAPSVPHVSSLRHAHAPVTTTYGSPVKLARVEIVYERPETTLKVKVWRHVEPLWPLLPLPLRPERQVAALHEQVGLEQLVQVAPAGQALPQAPHAAGSLLRLRQVPEQLVCPDGQVRLHAALTHAAEPPVGAVHGRLHAPQWAELVRVSTSHPLAVLPSQLAKPVLHAPNVHVPAAHVALALVNAHTRAHTPQLFTSVCVARQTPEQLVCPVGHAWPHTPPVQVALPPAAGAHT